MQRPNGGYIFEGELYDIVTGSYNGVPDLLTKAEQEELQKLIRRTAELLVEADRRYCRNDC